MDTNTNTTIEVTILEQGFSRSMTIDEFVTLLREEQKIWGQLSGKFHNLQLEIGGRHYAIRPIFDTGTNFFNDIIRKISADKHEIKEIISALVEDYQKHRIILWAGRIGFVAKEAIDNGRQHEGAAIAVAISSKWWAEGRDWDASFGIMRASMLLGAGAIMTLDLVSSKAASSHAEAHLAEARKAADEMAAFQRHHTELFVKLEKRYRDELTLEEPVRLWDRLHTKNRSRWRWSLAAFILAALLPCALVAYQWQDLSAAIVKITSNGNATFSLAGLALVTVPTIFYGWIVRNISRIFQQSLLLADDAQHRGTLALTYLGMAENKNGIAITEADRTLILNALFRPVPTAGQEDGLPAGLLEFLGKKS